MCTQTQTRMKNIKQRVTPTQWLCVVLPSTAVWIYWLLSGVPIHPSCKVHCLGSLEQQLQCSGSLCLSLSTSTAFLSTLYNQWRALGATWSLAGWLCWFRSAGCKRGHLSKTVHVSGEGEQKGFKELFVEWQRIGKNLTSNCTGQGFCVKTYWNNNCQIDHFYSLQR